MFCFTMYLKIIGSSSEDNDCQQPSREIISSGMFKYFENDIISSIHPRDLNRLVLFAADLHVIDSSIMRHFEIMRLHMCNFGLLQISIMLRTD